MGKPELTPELKERFFALYYEQKVSCYDEGTNRSEFHVRPEDAKHKFMYLLLRPISDLTDDEAIEVAKCVFDFQWSSGAKLYPSVERSREAITVSERYNTYYLCIDEVDGEITCYDGNELTNLGNCIWGYQKLISMGFTLPYCGHSVEELCAAGWVKLVENKTGKE